jgi:ATP-binding cassette subfamily B protein RaxB
MNALGALNFGFSRRLPIVLQTEGAECGLACLTMLAVHFGHQTNLVELRRRFGVSGQGATLKHLVRIADQIGLASRPLRLELDELSLLKVPCILHWDLNHFVVLKSVSRTNIVIHDPGAGIRCLPLSEVSKHFTGIALELTPTGGFEPIKAAPRLRLL